MLSANEISKQREAFEAALFGATNNSTTTATAAPATAATTSQQQQHDDDDHASPQPGNGDQHNPLADKDTMPGASTSSSQPPSAPSVPPAAVAGSKTSSAAIYNRSTARPVRKTPAFSIAMPERETVANHVQNVGSLGSGTKIRLTGKDGTTTTVSSTAAALGLLNGGSGGTSASLPRPSCSRPLSLGNPNNNPNHQNGNGGNTNGGSSVTSTSSRLMPSPTPSNGGGFNHSTALAMATPSGYHEHTFGASAFQATRLLPLLYLGNEGDAGMPNELRHRNIKRVLNVAFDCATQDYERYGIKVWHLPLRDCGDEDIGSHFEQCTRWIHEGISNNEGVIIHCRLGVSRSATIAIAYLMTYGIPSTTRVMGHQHRYRVVPLDQQSPQGQCRTCAKHGRRWLHYEDNAERILRGEFHTHPEECPSGEGKCYTDYGDVFTYVSMRREHISPNIGFAMQLRKLNVEHGFRDFLSEMSPGPSDDYCCSIESGQNIAACCPATPIPPTSAAGCSMGAVTTAGITPVTVMSMSTPSTHTCTGGTTLQQRGGGGSLTIHAHVVRPAASSAAGGGPRDDPDYDIPAGTIIMDSPLQGVPQFGDPSAKPAVA